MKNIKRIIATLLLTLCLITTSSTLVYAYSSNNFKVNCPVSNSSGTNGSSSKYFSLDDNDTSIEVIFKSGPSYLKTINIALMDYATGKSIDDWYSSVALGETITFNVPAENANHVLYFKTSTYENKAGLATLSVESK